MDNYIYSRSVATPTTRRSFSLFLIMIGCFFSSLCFAQTYDHVITTSTKIFDGSVTTVNPGDVVGIDAGERGKLTIQNITGTADDPVIFVNKGGQVRIGNFGSGEGIKILGSEHFELRGDGDPSVYYGIDVYKAGGQCIKIAGLSTNFEVCFIEVSNPGFAGIMAKTDPGSGGYATRGTFTQYDTVIHDIYAHDVPGESLYIGNSFYASGTPDGLPNDLVGVRVYNVISERSGREGIQVGSAISDCEIYDNVIHDAGLLGISSQRSGLQLGEGTTGKCYGNIIINAPANGIVCLGLGDNLIYNNVIANTGTNGLFCDNRSGAELIGSYLRIYNNTIINPARDGALIFNEITTNEFKNNIVIGSDAVYQAVDIGSSATVDDSNNVYQLTDAGLNFVNKSTDDYRLLIGSSAIDVGTTLSADAMVDLEGLARPFGSSYDAGAYESGALSVASFSTNPSIYGATDGSITASVIGGTSPYTYSWSNGASTPTISTLTSGVYSLTVTDSASASITRTVILTQPPELDTDVTIIPELDGANDGRIVLSSFGGTEPRTVLWDHGPTSFSLSSLDSGFYSYTITDANGATIGDTVFVRDAGTPLYRVNNGGTIEVDRIIDWEEDKGTTTRISPYLITTSGTSTTGSNSWSETNLTEGEDNLFGARRRITSSSSLTQMEWEFPVSAGYYEVQLYFNEVDTSVNAAGQRVFDVAIEDIVMIDDLDVYAQYDARNPIQLNSLIYVDDGVLDLDLIKVVGSPMISGIAIHEFGDMPEGFPVYRVNNGGIGESGTDGVEWEQDKKTTPSDFIVSSGQLTTGSNSWNSGGSNLTDAPDDVFAGYRYDRSGGQEMEWEFPLEAGAYRVNLYFIERDNTIGVGDRFFDVDVEGIDFLSSYDIFDSYGYLIPGQESMILEVDDGFLDLDFFFGTGSQEDAAVSAISIHRIR